ncbi:MAG: glycosyltransferase family 2 protein [Terracidiphilus sp.]
MAVELSIVMPCLNEAETLAACIGAARGFLLRSGVEGEIVIGDNGSTDGSQQIAARLGARVVAVPIRGYGAALYGAITAARGRYCILGDSDMSYDFSQLDAFLDALRGGADLVMGNRFRGGIRPSAMPWKNRYIGNPILSFIGRLLFHSQVRDFHCGLRGLSREAFLRMDLRTTGMEFASEMVIKARLLGMKTTEVPTTLSPDGRSRPPHLLPYRDGWRHLRFMLLFSPAWLFLYPGLAMMVLGAVAGTAILAQPVRVHGLQLGLDTLIYCGTLIAAGFQGVLFWFFSRVWALQERLYPQTASDNRYAKLVTLERGLAAGAALIVAGLAAAGAAVWHWKMHGFGDLDPERIGRLVIPSSLALSLGIEVVFSSFLLSTFGLRTRPFTAMAQEIEQARREEESHVAG